MSIWGHDKVYIVKHADRKCWEVFTAKPPRQLLVTIPWSDAIRDINHAHAPDYVEAIAACRQSDATDLTAKEEAELLKPESTMTWETTTTTTTYGPPKKPADTSAKPDAKPTERPNVLSMADFRKRKKR